MKNKFIYNISKIAFAIVLFQSQSYEVKAMFSLEDLDTVEYKRHYNSLPEVEESDKQIQESFTFPSFLKEAEKIIVQYELEPYVGLRLVHHHFPVEDNQIMGEEYQIYQEQPSLITSAYEIKEAISKKMIPSSWIFPSKNKEDINVFEASNDLAVYTGSKMIQKNPEFLDDMGKLLEENKLNNLISIAILKRENLVANENQYYLERNYSEPDKSVVQLWDVSKQTKYAPITTSWSFKGPREHKCIPSSRCEPRKHGHKVLRNHLKN